MSDLFTNKVRAGARIFEGDTEIARISRDMQLQGDRTWVELYLSDPAPLLSNPDEKAGALAVTTVFLTLDYQCGPIQIWRVYGEAPTPEQIAGTDMLIGPNDPSILDDGVLTHAMLANACKVLLEASKKYQFSYIDGVHGDTSRLEYGLEMHTHYAERGAKL
ncbi:hypothetical protein P67b_00042 [Ruegeria phage Tedan]|nr:hypothetical protein P67b_00042 [Ruegeria phage Tedan]